jgi:hypothetical protein
MEYGGRIDPIDIPALIHQLRNTHNEPLFHGMSNVEFEIARNRLSLSERSSLVPGQVLIPIPESFDIPGVLTKEDLTNMIKITEKVGTALDDSKQLITFISDIFSRYSSFDSFKGDTLRPKETLSIVRMISYAFRAKQYNQSR